MTKTNEASVHDSIQSLIEHLCGCIRKLPVQQRYMVGLVGYPGAGKSTISALLVDGINERCQDSPAKIVPMDGFHLPNEKLREMGLLELKGIPETFDAAGFVDLLKRLRSSTSDNVYCPKFDRSIEASIEDAIVIEPKHRMCVVEGNYLLLDRKPWSECRDYLDEAWFLDTTFDTILPRLHERHIQGGRTPEGAKEKVESTDLPNARLIDQTKAVADRLIRIGSISRDS